MSKPRRNESFTAWFNRQGILNFSAKEFTDYFGLRRRGVKNSTPPKRMWEAILPTLRLCDDARDHFGRPCSITSSYRSPAYNGAIPRAGKKSYHMKFIAMDIKIRGISPKRVADYFYKRRRAGDFKGGIGRYTTRQGAFTHIDTRGYNASWGRN